MSTKTPNFNLNIPEDTDSMDAFFDDYEENMYIIDNNLGGGGGGGSGKVIKNQTLTFAGLVATITDSDITADSDFIVYYYDEVEAETANITAVASLGTITFTAETAPLNPIVVDIILLDVSGGGGSSSLAGLTDVDLTTPTSGQVLTYDSTSQKWINANSSGGGLVVYSLTEQVIGKWVDNKPLYSRTLYLTNITVPANGSVDITLADYVPDIKITPDYKVVAFPTASSSGYVLPSVLFGTYFNYSWGASLGDGVVTITRSAASAVTADYYITVQYTKTTD